MTTIRRLWPIAALIAAPAVWADCTAPGEKVTDDPEGDAAVEGTVPDPVPAHDVTGVFVTEPNRETIAVTLKVADLSPAELPNNTYYVRFFTDDGVEHYLKHRAYEPVIADPVSNYGPFTYGHVEVSATGSASSVNDGPTDEGSQAASDGTITWVIAKSKIGGLSESQFMSSITGEADVLVGAPIAGGLLETVDSTPAGTYELGSCGGKSAAAASGKGILVSGGMGFAFVFPMGLAALLRRRRI